MVPLRGKTGTIPLSVPQVGHVFWPNWLFDDGRERSSTAVHQLLHVDDFAADGT